MLGLSMILVIFSANRITKSVADIGFTRDAVTIAIKLATIARLVAIKGRHASSSCIAALPIVRVRG